SWSTFVRLICVSGEWRFSFGGFPKPPQPTSARAPVVADADESAVVMTSAAALRPTARRNPIRLPFIVGSINIRGGVGQVGRVSGAPADGGSRRAGPGRALRGTAPASSARARRSGRSRLAPYRRPRGGSSRRRRRRTRRRRGRLL